MRVEAGPVAIVRVVVGPWGPLHLAATAGGIAAAGSMTTDEAFIGSLVGRLRGRIAFERDAVLLDDDPRTTILARAEAVIDEMAMGDAPVDVVPVDLSDRPAWDRRVLEAVREIGWGRTASYGTIAAMIGAPRAARAVGGAIGRNPVTLLIPCHRIIAADGTIGGYGGDGWGSRVDALDRKRAMLWREGVIVAAAAG